MCGLELVLRSFGRPKEGQVKGRQREQCMPSRPKRVSDVVATKSQNSHEVLVIDGQKRENFSHSALQAFIWRKRVGSCYAPVVQQLEVGIRVRWGRRSYVIRSLYTECVAAFQGVPVALATYWPCLVALQMMLRRCGVFPFGVKLTLTRRFLHGRHPVLTLRCGAFL